MLNGHLASLNVIIAGDVSETLNLHDFINCDVVCFYWLWCCDEKNNTRWENEICLAMRLFVFFFM